MVYTNINSPPGKEVLSITPTQFIYQAAMKTSVVNLTMGKQVKYEPVPVINVTDTKCWLCGGNTAGRGQPLKNILKPTFTDRDKAQASYSNSVCSACSFCLSYRQLRNYSILATETALFHPTRAEMKNCLLSPPNPPFVFCIAQSGQKWLHFKSAIAYSQDNYPVQMEDLRLTIQLAELKKILNIIETLYTVFTKEEIRTGQFSLNRIKQFGLVRFQDWVNLVSQYRGTRMFQLALYVAQKREEVPNQEPEKKEGKTICIITSTPSTKTTRPQLF